MRSASDEFCRVQGAIENKFDGYASPRESEAALIGYEMGLASCCAELENGDRCEKPAVLEAKWLIDMPHEVWVLIPVCEEHSKL